MLRRTRRRLFAAGAALAVLVVVGSLVFVRMIAWAIVSAPNRGVAVVADGEALVMPLGPRAVTLAVRILDVPSPRGTVFVLHGIRDRKESMLGWGRRLAAAGYRVVLPDSRGHGRSTGEWLTYGVEEARDLSQLLDELSARRLVDGPVGVMGLSYGAATAIEWAGHDPRVRAVVAVAPFASLREVVPEYLARLAPVLHRVVPEALVGRGIRYAGGLGGFDPDEASPRAAIARTLAPVLLVHGGADIHIPPRHSERLRDVGRDHSTLIILDAEDHLTIGADRSGELWRAALAFFPRHLRSQ